MSGDSWEAVQVRINLRSSFQELERPIEQACQRERVNHVGQGRRNERPSSGPGEPECSDSSLVSASHFWCELGKVPSICSSVKWGNKAIQLPWSPGAVTSHRTYHARHGAQQSTGPG